jgi:hypothetical protein
MIAVGWRFFLYLTATENPICLRASLSLMFRKKKRVGEDEGVLVFKEAIEGTNSYLVASCGL